MSDFDIYKTHLPISGVYTPFAKIESKTIECHYCGRFGKEFENCESCGAQVKPKKIEYQFLAMSGEIECKI